jgi:hypothetical protein
VYFVGNPSSEQTGFVVRRAKTVAAPFPWALLDAATYYGQHAGMATTSLEAHAILARSCARIFLLQALLAVLVLSSGCIDSSIQWLPDSSGFLLDHGGKVSLYSLATRQSRTVVAATGSQWPSAALRPDGTELAVVEGGTAKKPAISLIFYGLDGRETRRSGEIAFQINDTFSLNGAASWTLAGDRVLVHGQNSVAVYDVARSKFKIIDGVTPFSVFGTPVRPDGKGFLGVRSAVKLDCFFFVDWEGREYQLAEDDATSKTLASQDENDNSNRTRQCMLRTRWKGAKLLVCAGPRAILEFDTEKRVIVVRKDAEALLTKGSDLPFDEHAFPDGKAVLRIVTVDGAPTKLRFQPKRGQLKTLLTVSDDSLMMFPSPDGRAVAVAVGGRGGEMKRVLAVNQSGGEPESAFDLAPPDKAPMGK